MRSTAIVLCVAVVLVLSLGAGRVQEEEWTATCVEVVDGDTIFVNRNGDVIALDLEAVDAPEIGQDYGEESKQFLSDLVLDKEITVKLRSVPGGGASRARVFLGEQDLNREILAAGAAWHDIDTNSEEDLVLTMVLARTARKGLWAEPEPEIPSRWRERMRPVEPTPTPRPKQLADLARSVEVITNQDEENDEERIGRAKKVNESASWVDLEVSCSCSLGEVEPCCKDVFQRVFAAINTDDESGSLIYQPAVVKHPDLLLVFKGVSKKGRIYTGEARWPKAATKVCTVKLRVPKVSDPEPK